MDGKPDSRENPCDCAEYDYEPFLSRREGRVWSSTRCVGQIRLCMLDLGQRGCWYGRFALSWRARGGLDDLSLFVRLDLQSSLFGWRVRHSVSTCYLYGWFRVDCLSLMMLCKAATAIDAKTSSNPSSPNDPEIDPPMTDGRHRRPNPQIPTGVHHTVAGPTKAFMSNEVICYRSYRIGSPL